MSYEDTWVALEREWNAPEKPEGALTAAEFGVRFNLAPGTVSHTIKRMIAAGKLRSVECMALNVLGKRCKTMAYLPNVGKVGK